MPRFMKRRRNGWYSNISIPKELRHHFGGQHLIEKTLRTSDQKVAQAKARKLKSEYDIRFLALKGDPDAKRMELRRVYLETFEEALGAEFVAISPDPEQNPKSLGIDLALDGLVEEAERRRFSPEDTMPEDIRAKISGLVDAEATHLGRPIPRRVEYEPTFKEAADKWLSDWKAEHREKATNTPNQYSSTIRLFEGFIGDLSIRQITRPRAVEFIDILKTFGPHWGRSPRTKERSFGELKALYAEKGHRLSQGTLNRHINVLKEIWEYAETRELAEGKNPFRRLTKKAKYKTYLPWEPEELKTLLSPPPKRSDLHEIILVALYSAMRVNEIASLRWMDLKEKDSIAYFDIPDAKTEAGIRQVPVHPSLGWLLERTKGKPEDPIWPKFNPEGPGGKRGEDASKLFGSHAVQRGFKGRRKGFHSFRKNVTKIMERSGVAVNEWQEIIGHQKGLTYGVYNPHGLTLKKKQEIIELINYGPELSGFLSLNN